MKGFTKRFYLALGVYLLALWLVALWAYPRMPAHMVTHWDWQGQPDDWMPRLWGVLLGPGMTTFLAALLFFVVPAIEPWRRNLMAFWDFYVRFAWAVLVFLGAMYGVTLAWNLGYPVRIERVVGLALGLLFLMLVPLLRQARPNWFVGIRTPWTLASPWVWRRVHDVAARTVVGVAALYLAAALWPVLLWAALAATLLWAFGLMVYSYLLYRSRQQAMEG